MKTIVIQLKLHHCDSSLVNKQVTSSGAYFLKDPLLELPRRNWLPSSSDPTAAIHQQHNYHHYIKCCKECANHFPRCLLFVDLRDLHCDINRPKLWQTQAMTDPHCIMRKWPKCNILNKPTRENNGRPKLYNRQTYKPTAWQTNIFLKTHIVKGTHQLTFIARCTHINLEPIRGYYHT